MIPLFLGWNPNPQDHGMERIGVKGGALTPRISTFRKEAWGTDTSFLSYEITSYEIIDDDPPNAEFPGTLSWGSQSLEL